MKILFTSYAAALIAIIIVEILTKERVSNLFDWMVWFMAPIYVSIFTTIVFKVFIWVNPDLSRNSSGLTLMVIFVSCAIGTLISWPEKSFNPAKEEMKQKLKLVKLFDAYQPILPNPTTEEYDKNIIKAAIKESLIDFDFGNEDNMSEQDSSHFELISEFFPIGWSKFKGQIEINSRLYKYLHFLAESTKIKFFTYSPDYNYFVVYIKFELSEGHKERTQTCRIALGEKNKDEIKLYDFTSGLDHWLRTTDESFYRFLTGWRGKEPFIKNFARHTLTRDFEYPLYNILEKEFWEDPNLFSSIDFEGDSIMRFKTTNIKYHNGVDKVTDYQIRKSFSIKLKKAITFDKK